LPPALAVPGAPVSTYQPAGRAGRLINDLACLNKISDADLLAIIGHGGSALNKSPLMPPYGYTLSKPEIQALVAYIRLISDPPYQASGMVYGQK
jgi:hypothetical protein